MHRSSAKCGGKERGKQGAREATSTDKQTDEEAGGEELDASQATDCASP